MTSLQCPNCGADLRVEDSAQGFVVCRYCDSRISLTDDRTPEQNRAEAERIRAETERMAFERQAKLEEQQRIAREQELARLQAESAQREQAAQEARKEASKREYEARQARLEQQKDNTRKCGLILAVSIGAWLVSYILFRVLRRYDILFPVFFVSVCVLAVSSLMVPVFLVKTISSKWEETRL